MSMLPVSIIIPARNEESRLPQCLETALAAARQHQWEVIVVDDGSTDNTTAIAESMGARLIRLAHPSGVAAARNIGASNAHGDILVFLDADIVALPDTLCALVDRLAGDPAIHCTGACPGRNLNPLWSAHFVGLRARWGARRLNGKDVVGFSSFQSECGAIRRDTFEKIGGFPEKHVGVGMEEFAMGHAMELMGYRNVLLAQAFYSHHYKPLMRRCRELVHRTKRWVPLLLSRHRFESPGAVGTHVESISCALTALLILAAFLALVYPPARIFTLAILLAQLFVEWSFLDFARREHGLRMMLYSWVALQTMHVAIAIGFVCGLADTICAHFTRSQSQT